MFEEQLLERRPTGGDVSRQPVGPRSVAQLEPRVAPAAGAFQAEGVARRENRDVRRAGVRPAVEGEQVVGGGPLREERAVRTTDETVRALPPQSQRGAHEVLLGVRLVRAGPVDGPAIVRVDQRVLQRSVPW